MPDVVLIAIKAILTNKVRTFLTTLGVIIGVASVVLLTAIGNGLSAFVTDQFNELGANTVLVLPGDAFGENGVGAESAATSLVNSKLSMQEVRNLQRLREHVKELSPFNLQQDSVSYRTETKYTTILGTTANLTTTFNVPVSVGRFFSENENDAGDRVAVLGYTIADELFGEIDPIGKKIKIGDLSYTVVGVADEKGGGFGGPSFDTYIYIPIETFFNVYDTDTIVRIVVKATTTERLQEHMNAIEGELLKTLESDEFSVVDQSEILSTITQILDILTLGLSGIASISLLVGGIGIMNIMLVSVTERTREIGLRKALGATPNGIMLQFLIEAAILSLIGGTVGLLLAYGGVLAMQAFIPAKITMESILLAIGVSTAVGLIFGAAPAKRAADLSPIEALRYE